MRWSNRMCSLVAAVVRAGCGGDDADGIAVGSGAGSGIWGVGEVGEAAASQGGRKP